jgi:hypothetical protein
MFIDELMRKRPIVGKLVGYLRRPFFSGLPDEESFHVFVDIPTAIILQVMKKIKNAARRTKHVAKRDGYFRRFVRNFFKSFMIRQNGDYQKDIEKIAQKLQDIEDSIEIIARKMARQAKCGD